MTWWTSDESNLPTRHDGTVTQFSAGADGRGLIGRAGELGREAGKFGSFTGDTTGTNRHDQHIKLLYSQHITWITNITWCVYTPINLSDGLQNRGKIYRYIDDTCLLSNQWLDIISPCSQPSLAEASTTQDGLEHRYGDCNDDTLCDKHEEKSTCSGKQ